MNFGDIRNILNNYTMDCEKCPAQEYGEGFGYCNDGCKTFLARRIKEDIFNLAYGVEIRNDFWMQFPRDFKVTLVGYINSVHKGTLVHGIKSGDMYQTEDNKKYFWYDGSWYCLDTQKRVED